MHRQTSILYWALLCAAVLAGLNLLAYAFYFYWTVWWYDVMMHFLAGVTAGLATYWVLFNSGLVFKSPKSAAFSIMAVFLCVLIAGVGWEIFEYVNGITDSHEGYRLDTTNDLILDSAGGIFAALFGLRGRRKNNG